MPLVTRTTTAGNVIKQDSEPDDKTKGTIWIDTSDSPNSINVANGTSYESPSIKVSSTTIAMKAMI